MKAAEYAMCPRVKCPSPLDGFWHANVFSLNMLKGFSHEL